MGHGLSVYLAGPITGCKYGEATDWREYAKNELAKGTWVDGKPINSLQMTQGYYTHSGIIAYSPMRAKGYLDKMENMPDADSRFPLTTPQAIIQRDYYDVRSSDAMLVNFLGAQRVSIGTVMEIGFAHSHRISTVVVMDKGNLHDHEFIKASVGWLTEDLDTGIQLVKNILLP